MIDFDYFVQFNALFGNAESEFFHGLSRHVMILQNLRPRRKRRYFR
jgi:hypothetical protein